MAWDLKNFSKNFGGVNALNDVSATLEEGKVYGLVGANGSGKSTLIKTLTGVVSPDEGELFKEGEKLEIESPRDSQRYGIYASYQNLSLAPHLSVLDNLLLGIESKQKKFFLNRDEMVEKAEEILSLVRADLPLNENVENLTRNEMQLLENLKLFARDPDLALFDEPTSYLAKKSIEDLFQIIDKLREKGKTVVFVSHRLEEVFEKCEETIVLRDGNKVGKFDLSQMSEEELASKMAGSKEKVKSGLEKGEKEKRITEEKPEAEAFFSVKNLTNPNLLGGLSFEATKGEVIGIAGLTGQGQSSLLKSLYGIITSSGEIRLGGKNLEVNSPKDAIENGIIYVSGDKDLEGLLPSRSVKENIALIKNSERRLVSLVDEEMEENLADRMVGELSIDCESIEEKAFSLSGGNQQKLFLGRGLAEDPKVLLLNDPFKGVDVMTKNSITRKLSDLKEDRVIIFYSSEVEDVVPIASRVLVMYEGEIIAEFVGEEISADKIEESSIRGGD